MAGVDLSFWLKWVSAWKAEGVSRAVVCPGSRSSPILQALITAGWDLFSCVDERSAGYQALGMAQAFHAPVVVLTTSGTAAANLAPAMAEAFFSRVPLVAWTADRPAEWIGQEDNQAIHQVGLFGQHTRGAWNLPLADGDDLRNWHIDRCAREARAMLRECPSGPIHLNIPFREPLYGTPTNWDRVPAGNWSFTSLASEDSIDFSAFKCPLLLHGQPRLGEDHLPTTGIGEVLSYAQCRLPAEAWLPALAQNENLRPDLIVTTGGPFVSKSLRHELRKWSFTHAHLGSTNAEVFCRPVESISAHTLKALDSEALSEQTRTARQRIRSAWDMELSLEFAAVRRIVETLPEGSNVHLGNSLPVRIASLLPNIPTGLKFWCNRGTSGIDGSMSAAVGHALATPNEQHLLIIGDQSFFYDRNALWREILPSNLKIVLLNNHEGAIFRALDGPTEWKDDLRFWTTPHKRSAEFTARDHGLQYESAHSLSELDHAWNVIRNESTCALLEVFTDAAETAIDFRRILTFLRETETA